MGPAKLVVRMQHTPTTFHGIAKSPKKSADACLFCFTPVIARSKLNPELTKFGCSQLSLALGGPDPGLIFERVMGTVMKKIVLLATALAMISGSALAADMPVKAVKAPPPPAFEPWDFAFGSALMNDYIFRGITQSNHKPSVAAYFEPRYNLNKDLQLYIGFAGESISFPNRAAAEIDIYGGIR